MKPLNTYRHSVLIFILMAITLLGSLPGLSSLQVIDRDEARFAQASVQMRDSGDYVNIRFHDRDRHKKPAGVYWLQTASLKLFSSPEKRDIWVHRLPSVIAGLLSVIGLYWAGLTLYGRRGAFIGALLLGTSLLFIFESHIAKTDAALCAAAVWTLGAILRLRDPQCSKTQFRDGLILWTALGCAVIVKGPILPAIVSVAWLTILIWERKLDKTTPNWSVAFNPLGICLFGLIVLPWYIMIHKATGGTFLGAAISGDLTPKLTGGQESHGVPPGFYILTVFVTFWPAALFLLTAFAYGFKATKGADADVNAEAIKPAQSRWLLAWIIPFWLILELVPTKLTHYVLPLFPAIALLMAGAIIEISAHKSFGKTRIIGAVIFFMISASLVFTIAGADAFYGQSNIWMYGLAIFILILALLTTVWACQGRIMRSLTCATLTGLGLSIPTYAQVMPNLDRFRIAPNIEAQLAKENISLPRNGGPLIRSPHFTEPSLIYHLGTNVLLGQKADNYPRYPVQPEQIWIIDEQKPDSETRSKALKDLAAYNGMCLSAIGKVSGVNYSNGDDVDLKLYTISDC
ncbi:MAG: glycosyltransferase family 39 protein [Maricaulaceae bacterium]